MRFDTLYKTDSKDKIREWNIEVVDLGSHAEIIVTHGAKDGQMQRKVTEIWEGKNTNKANATSFLQQAYSESLSKWNKQKDKGYSETIEDRVFLPMLAKSFKDHEKKVVYPCAIQTKFDGGRSTFSWDSKLEDVIGLSRKGKVWQAVGHINHCLSNFLEENQNIILDGELFTTEISFQKICSAIKRKKANSESLLVEFHCYDLYDKNNPDLTFAERSKLIPNLPKPFVKVETYECKNKEEVLARHELFVQKGFEGSIIRNLNGKYKVDGRSFDLLKLKDFQEKEYKIIDKRLDKNGDTVFFCLDEELNEGFSCKPKGTHFERELLYKEDNIGKMLTVIFFEFTEKGLPRFGVGKTIRDYE